MNLFKDARDYQIICLCLFLLVGFFFRDWTLEISQIILTIFSCLFTQIILTSWIKFTNNQVILNTYHLNFPGFFQKYLDFSGVKSALISGLGLSLLLRANKPEILILAGVMAISSKFLFTYHNKHFFNPANFGIITSILLTHSAWVSPAQWGSERWYLLLFFCTGTMVSNKVGRWETSAIFLVVYSALQGFYNFYLGWDIDVLTHQLMSGSLLVFAFFMLTDPRSIPNAQNSRIFWTILVAIISFILQQFFYVNGAIFYALFIVSPLTIFFDIFWKENRFRWQEE